MSDAAEHLTNPAPMKHLIEEGPGELLELVNRLAGQAVGVGADDLQELAQIHSGLEQIAAQCPTAAAAAAAATGAELVGQLILREADDAAAALAKIGRQIDQVRQLIEGGDASDASAATVEEASAPDSASAQVADGAEHAPVDGPEPLFGPDEVPLVHEFIGEAFGHLDAAEAQLLTLEQQPHDADAINAVFRSFHTIKGVAGFLNLKQIGALAHASETLLDLARQNALEISGPTASLVLEASDCMRALVAELDEAVKRGAAAPPHEGLGALVARLQARAAGKEPAPPATTSPTASDAEPPAEVESPAQAASPSPAATSAPERRIGEDRRQGDRRSAEANGPATVKVSTERLDSLINMIGELVISQSMVSQDVTGLATGNHRLLRNLSQLGKITRELQDLSMGMGMVPIQGVFQKMNRLVRDLAQKAGKQVDLVISGGETELDRNVVDAISDPLVHMVRNAADHGIEPPADRLSAGKPATGRLELRAEHKAGNILIHISDDGRGLNKARILKKAIAAGIVREGQELSEQEIFRLIFHAGLSTAEKVTDVSGRGVGMDVVKRNIESLRGRIEITSVEGQGATFTIRLPLTLAVIDGLLVGVGDERYILPITSIEQSVRPKPDQVSTLQDRGEVCLIRGTVLPLFRLHRLFNVKPRNADPTQALVVIVHDNDRRCCLLVDDLLGQQQVVIKSLGDGIGQVRGLSGGAILGDGNVSLILDVPGLIDAATQPDAPLRQAA